MIVSVPGTSAQIVEPNLDYLAAGRARLAPGNAFYPGLRYGQVLRQAHVPGIPRMLETRLLIGFVFGYWGVGE